MGVRPAPRWLLVVVAALPALASCARPIHRRTYVFADPGARHDHPADVPSRAMELVLAGRVHAADGPGLATAMASAFRRLRPDQHLYYRHPSGGAWTFAVEGGALVVRARGRRGDAVERYDLGELRRAAEAGPPAKVAEPGAIVPIDGQHAELEVDVAFAIEQFVFVDGVFAGSVPPGGTRVFRARPGRITVTASDSPDGAVNAVTAVFELRAGRRQRWSILPRL